MRNKNQLLNLSKLCFIFILALGTSCSSDAPLLDNESALESQEITNSINDDALDGKKSSPKTINDGCDNPRISGTNSYYRIYTADEVGISNDVNKVSSNRKTEEIDDRTCEYNYTQTVTSGKTYGRYRLKADTNGFDALQPRIERASVTANSNAPGTVVRLKGVVRVFRVGDATRTSSITSLSNNGGTYICQAKGTDTRTTNDPALALLLVKASAGTGSNQTKFKFFSEYMSGSIRSSNTRSLYDFNFEVNKGDAVEVTMANQFTGTSCNTLKHSVNISLKNLRTNVVKSKTFTMPEPKRGEQAKIRYGAYRCWSGEADIRWRSGLTMTSKVGSGTKCDN